MAETELNYALCLPGAGCTLSFPAASLRFGKYLASLFFRGAGNGQTGFDQFGCLPFVNEKALFPDWLEFGFVVAQALV